MRVRLLMGMLLASSCISCVYESTSRTAPNERPRRTAIGPRGDNCPPCANCCSVVITIHDPNAPIGILNSCCRAKCTFQSPPSPIQDQIDKCNECLLGYHCKVNESGILIGHGYPECLCEPEISISTDCLRAPD